MKVIKICEAFSEKKVRLVFKRTPKNFISKLLFKIGIQKQNIAYDVTPTTLGTRALFSTYIKNIDLEQLSKDLGYKRLESLIFEKDCNDLFTGLAVIIHNKQSDPPKWLIEEIRCLDNDALLAIIAIVNDMLDTKSFMNSIISIVGMSLQTEEIIAPEKQKDLEGIK